MVYTLQNKVRLKTSKDYATVLPAVSPQRLLPPLHLQGRDVDARLLRAAKNSTLKAATGVAGVGTLVLSTPSDRDNGAALQSAGGGLRLRARKLRARNESATEETVLKAATGVAGVVTLVVSTPSDRDNSATSKGAGGGLRLRALLAVNASDLGASESAVSASAGVAVVGALVLSSPSVSNNSSALKLTGLLCRARCVQARNLCAAKNSTLKAATGVAGVGALVLSTPSDRDNGAALQGAGLGLRLRARKLRARNHSATEETVLKAATGVAGVVTLVVSTPSDRDNSATSKGAGGGLRLRALLAVNASDLGASESAVSASAGVAVVGALVLSSPSVSNNSSALKLTGLLRWAWCVQARNLCADEASTVSAATGVAGVGALVVSTPASRDNGAALQGAGFGLRLRARKGRARNHSAAKKSTLKAATGVAGVGTLVVSTPSDRDDSAALQSAGCGLGCGADALLAGEAVFAELVTAVRASAAGFTDVTLRGALLVVREAVVRPVADRAAPLVHSTVHIVPAHGTCRHCCEHTQNHCRTKHFNSTMDF